MMNAARTLLVVSVAALLGGGALDPACVATLGAPAAWVAASDVPVTWGVSDLVGRRASFDLFTSGDEVQGEVDAPLARLRRVVNRGPLPGTIGGVPFTRPLSALLDPPLVDAGPPGKDRRAAIVARDGAGIFGAASSSRVHTGPFEARVTVAVDDLAGLFSGKTAGVLEADLPPGADPARFAFVRARVLADAGGLLGFAVDAVSQSGPLGGPELLLGTSQVDLRIVRDETSLHTSARVTPVTEDDPAAWTTISSQALPLDEPSFSVLFGAAGLVEGGRVLFSDFALSGPGVGGPLERPLVDALVAAVEPLGAALALLDVEAPDVSGASGPVGDARDALLAVRAEILEAGPDGAFQASTRAARAAAALARAVARLDGALALLDLDDPARAPQAVRRIGRALRDAARSVADLLGRNAPRFGVLPEPRLLPD